MTIYWSSEEKIEINNVVCYKDQRHCLKAEEGLGIKTGLCKVSTDKLLFFCTFSIIWFITKSHSSTFIGCWHDYFKNSEWIAGGDKGWGVFLNPGEL